MATTPMSRAGVCQLQKPNLVDLERLSMLKSYDRLIPGTGQKLLGRNASGCRVSRTGRDSFSFRLLAKGVIAV